MSKSILSSLMTGSALSGVMLHAKQDDTAAKAKPFKDGFKEATGRDIRLSDSALVAIVNKVEGWDEMEGEEQLALLTKAEETMDTISVADPAISSLVSKIDDVAEAELTACIDAVMKGKTTAVDVYAQFKRIYTKEELDAMPYPGTEKDHVTGNQKPDIVKTTDQTGKPITKVWTNDFVSAMGRGKEFETIISDVNKEKKAVNSVPSLKGYSKAELASKLSDATARRNALRSMVKRSISLHHQLEAIYAMPHVGIQWIKSKVSKENSTIMPDKFGEAKGKPVAASPKPLWIYPATDPGNGRDFSVTQLLAFDPAKALKMPEGGTMAELIATAQNEPEPGQLKAMAEAEFEELIPDISGFLQKRENMALLLKRLNSKDPAESNDLLESLVTIYLNLKPIYDKNKARYEALQQKEDTERKVA